MHVWNDAQGPSLSSPRSAQILAKSKKSASTDYGMSFQDDDDGTRRRDEGYEVDSNAIGGNFNKMVPDESEQLQTTNISDAGFGYVHSSTQATVVASCPIKTNLYFCFNLPDMPWALKFEMTSGMTYPPLLNNPNSNRLP